MSWWIFKKKPKPKPDAGPAIEACLEWIEQMEKLNECLERARKVLRDGDEDEEIQINESTSGSGDDECAG